MAPEVGGCARAVSTSYSDNQATIISGGSRIEERGFRFSALESAHAHKHFGVDDACLRMQKNKSYQLSLHNTLGFKCISGMLCVTYPSVYAALGLSRYFCTSRRRLFFPLRSCCFLPHDHPHDCLPQWHTRRTCFL